MSKKPSSNSGAPDVIKEDNRVDNRELARRQGDAPKKAADAVKSLERIPAIEVSVDADGTVRERDTGANFQFPALEEAQRKARRRVAERPLMLKKKAVRLWNRLAAYRKQSDRFQEYAPQSVQALALEIMSLASEGNSAPAVPHAVWFAVVRELRSMVEACSALQWFACYRIAQNILWLIDIDYTVSRARAAAFAALPPDLVEKLKRAGLTRREIGLVSGVSHTTVQRSFPAIFPKQARVAASERERRAKLDMANLRSRTKP